MKKNGAMQRKALHVAVAGAIAALGFAAGPAFADATSELKAEIAAQRAQLEQQRLRLEAMEKKLETVSAQQTASPPAAQPTAEATSWTPKLVAGPNWEPGFTFQVTPVDTVTLYGLIDATISDISNANTRGDHKRSFQTAWLSGDRWGITGKHAISDSTSVIFKLESEFDYQTGEEDTPGVLFNRDAWVGFQSDTLGKLTFGRQNALARDFTGIYGDPFTSSRVTLEEGGYTNTNNFKQLIFYAASATGTRYDRGVVWKKDFGGLVAGLGYQFGGSQSVGDFQKGSTQTVALGYNAPRDIFHLAGYYNHFNVNDLVHKAWSFGGNVELGPVVRLNAGYYKYDSEQGGGVGKRRDHAWTASTKIVPGGPLEFDLGYQVITAVNAGVNSAGNVLTPYADAAGVTRTANGDKKTLYGAVMYHFDRRAEVYFVTDYMKLTDNYRVSTTFGHNSQVEAGVGMRIRF
jgi:predicted porin/uncharacterized coiled-coil protein SlyX